MQSNHDTEKQASRSNNRSDAKKLLFKAMLFVLIIGLPLLVVNHAYRETNYFRGELNDRARLTGMPADVSLVTLGDSHEASNLTFGDIYKAEAYNLAATSQSPRYSYSLLVENAERLTKGAVVLIPISAYTLETDFPSFYKKTEGMHDTRYYPILRNKTHLDGYSLENDLLYNYLPILTAKENLVYILNDVEWPGTSIILSNSRVEDIDAIADMKASSWMHDVMVDETDVAYREQTVKENLKQYQMTIDFCNEQGFVPVLLISPNTEQLIERLGADRIARFYEEVRTLCTANPEVVLLDYLKDERFAKNLLYFRDSDHLNAEGARAYSEVVLHDLADKGIIAENLVTHRVTG